MEYTEYIPIDDLCGQSAPVDDDNEYLPKTFYGTPTKKLYALDPFCAENKMLVPIKCSVSKYLTWNQMPPDPNHCAVHSNGPLDDHCQPGKKQLAAMIQTAAENFLTLPSEAQVAVMDINCVFGGLVAALREVGFEAYGADWRGHLVGPGIAFGNKYIKEGTFEDFLSDKFIFPQLFVSNQSLAGYREPALYLSRLHRVLSDEAIVCLTWPNGNKYPASVGRYDISGPYVYPNCLHFFGPYASFRLLMDNGFSVLDIRSFSYDGCTLNKIEKYLTSLTPEVTIDYESIRESLDKDFAGEELFLVFCKEGSGAAEKNQAAIARALDMFRQFQEAGI